MSTRRLGPTLLRLAGIRSGDAGLPQTESLPGLSELAATRAPQPIYSETWMPASAYGWAPLTALSDQRWRLIVAPRPELYDYVADPDETRNLLEQEVEEAKRLRGALQAYEAELEVGQPARLGTDPELATELRSLGYLAGSRGRSGTIDPKDGVAMLAEFGQAKELVRRRQFERAIPILQDLAKRNPENIPFLTHLAGALQASGQGDAAIAVYQRAVDLAPELDFVQQHLADAYLRLGRTSEARQAYRRTLELNPRAASAWLKLAELELRSGRPDEEKRLLLEAVEKGTTSAVIHSRLGQLEAAAGQTAAAHTHFEEAARLTPEWGLVWLLWGDLAEHQGQLDDAATRYAEAVRVEPGNAGAHLRLGRVTLGLGRVPEAQRYLRRAVSLAPGSPEAREAQSLLAQLEQQGS